jgi:hypothetical protein
MNMVSVFKTHVSHFLLSQLTAIFLIYPEPLFKQRTTNSHCSPPVRTRHDYYRFCTHSGVLARRLRRGATAGAGSYPIHLLSDFIGMRARAIFCLYISSSLLKLLPLRLSE